MPALQFQKKPKKTPGDTSFISEPHQKAKAFLKTLLAWSDPAALLLRHSCAIKIRDGSDLETREKPPNDSDQGEGNKERGNPSMRNLFG